MQKELYPGLNHMILSCNISPTMQEIRTKLLHTSYSQLIFKKCVAQLMHGSYALTTFSISSAIFSLSIQRLLSTKNLMPFSMLDWFCCVGTITFAFVMTPASF